MQSVDNYNNNGYGQFSQIDRGAGEGQVLNDTNGGRIELKTKKSTEK